MTFDVSKELIIGSTVISINIIESVDEIRVSAADMLWDMFTPIIVDDSGVSVPIQKYHVDSKAQIVTIFLLHSIPSGLYELRMEFGSMMRKDLMGCYISYAKDNQGISRPFVVSQFEPNYARTCFPTFDEPDVKMPFSISLTIPEEMEGLSNTNIVI